MDVKGTAFVARRTYLVGRFGQDAFDEFYEAFRAGRDEFDREISAVSTLPSADFMAFNDAVLEHFFEGRADAHTELGHASAEWALREGPYKAFFKTKRYSDFLRTAPSLWKAYYSEGGFEASISDDGSSIDAYIMVPPSDVHVHFELNVMAYLHRALELTGATVLGHEVVEGFTRGDARVRY